MTTANCTCGADQFPGAKHVGHCPAADALECDCGAVNFEGAQHKVTCPMISTSHPAYMPPRLPQTGSQGHQRRKVEDDRPIESQFTNLKFFFGVPPRVGQVHPDGAPAEIEAGQIVGKLVEYREQETNFGLCAFADIEICVGEFSGVLVSFICGTPPDNTPQGKSSMLARLMRQVQKGEVIEITRERDRGRAHAYTVEVLE